MILENIKLYIAGVLFDCQGFVKEFAGFRILVIYIKFKQS